MTAENFSASVAFTLLEEGGFSNDPRDPGGATNYGITVATLSEWRGADCTSDDVAALGQDEAESIYRARYWNVIRGDALPAGVDLMVFDEAVNAGPGSSVKLLQTILGVQADGVIGPITLRVVFGDSAATLLPALRAVQESRYRSLRDFETFGAGWLARLGRRYRLACKFAGIDPQIGG